MYFIFNDEGKSLADGEMSTHFDKCVEFLVKEINARVLSINKMKISLVYTVEKKGNGRLQYCIEFLYLHRLEKIVHRYFRMTCIEVAKKALLEKF